jgi:hypothetical protein
MHQSDPDEKSHGERRISGGLRRFVPRIKGVAWCKFTNRNVRYVRALGRVGKLLIGHKGSSLCQSCAVLQL